MAGAAQLGALAGIDARPGDLILYEDSYRNLSIAINGGNAAAMFNIKPGRDVRIHFEPA